MPCYHPLLAFPGKLSKNGKVTYIPRKVPDNEINMYQDKDWLKSIPYEQRPILVPCGKCIGCRLDYSRVWAYRCMMELKYHESAYFITLTYNDDMIPVHYFRTEKGGELPAYSLEKRDFQLWLKRLRKKLDYPIRFFGCGEYGSDTLRPHYHCIVFGLKLDDLVIYKRTDQGVLYKSDFLQSTWIGQKNRGKVKEEPYKYLGFVVIGQVNFNTAAYVARYTAKKAMTVGNDFFQKFNLEKPFIDMSRRPGIGYQYFQDHPEMFDSNEINLPTSEKGYTFTIPKYFLKKLEGNDNELFEKITKERKERGSVYAIALACEDKRNYTDIIKAKEESMLSRSRGLQKRNLQ